MGVASLVLGILSLIVSFIPCCGTLAIIPAIIALILGIVEVVKKSKEQQPKGMGIAGIVLSAIAMVVIIAWFFLFGVAASTADYNNVANSINTYSSYYSNYYEDYDY